MKQKKTLKFRMADKNILLHKTPEEVMEALTLQEPIIKQILILHLFKQMNVPAIANAMSLTTSAVYKKLQQGFYYLDKYFNTSLYQQVQTILYTQAVNRVAY